MAFDDYLAVLDSDLYEYRGTTKAILARIAHLIIAPPEEGPNGKPLHESHPDEGFCIATQEYLACQLGISESTVSDAVKTFVKDGWLNITKSRDQYGHDRYKYAWAEGALEKIKARKRHRDERGEYVREKQVRKQRAIPTGQFARRVTSVNEASTTRDAPVNTAPSGNLRGGLQADCEVAARQVAEKPPGKLPAVVGVEVGLKSRCDEHVTKNKPIAHHASLNKSKPTPTPKTLQTYDDNERASTPANPTPRGVAPNPTEASRLETPGTSLSPIGDAPIPPRPAPKLPKAHSSHKWRSWIHRDKEHTSCEFCGCCRTSIAAGRVCRPDSWSKEEAAAWVASQDAATQATTGATA
jgi:hypothetical protein